jgi:hypothetical protein
MCVCMYVCVYVGIMYVCIYVCKHEASMYTCNVCMHIRNICMYIYIYMRHICI